MESGSNKKYYTIKGAAELLGVSAITLRNWDRKKKLLAYRHPINNYRIYKSDQLELLRRRIESSRQRRASTKIDVV